MILPLPASFRAEVVEPSCGQCRVPSALLPISDRLAGVVGQHTAKVRLLPPSAFPKQN